MGPATDNMVYKNCMLQVTPTIPKFWLDPKSLSTIRGLVSFILSCGSVYGSLVVTSWKRADLLAPVCDFLL